MTKIGIAISTVPSRRHLILETLAKWEQFAPLGSVIVIVEDTEYEGVAKTKNQCLSLLESKGVSEYFLVDDDCWPISKDWHKPFIDSPEPHMMYNFRIKGKSIHDMTELYRDENIVSYTHTRGCMIYLNQSVLDKVGGFDERYYNGFEHPDLTTRVHNAGLTTHRSMSPVDCDKLFYCLDQDNKIESSIGANPKITSNARLYRQSKTSIEFKEYRNG